MSVKGFNKKMIYTPERHIPIGEAIKTETGEYALVLKRKGENEYETMPMGQLMSKVVQVADSTT